MQSLGLPPHYVNPQVIQVAAQDIAPHSPLSQMLIQAVGSKGSLQSECAVLQRQVIEVKPEELNDVLAMAVKALMLADDPIQAMEDLAKLLPLKQLQDAIRIKYPDHEDALATAREMLKSAEAYLEKIDHPFTPTLGRQIQALATRASHLFESFIGAFGLIGFFSQTQNDPNGNFTGKKLLSTFQLLNLLASGIVTIMGKDRKRSIVIAVFLLIISLSVGYPFIRPAPSFLPLGDNLTRNYQEGRLAVVNGRSSVLRDIGDILFSRGVIKKHPILIGPPGVGKTETVMRFAKSLKDGLHPGYEDMEVHYYNTADLVNDSNGRSGEDTDTLLQKITDSIGPHQKKVIIVLDEIHFACQGSGLIEKLKTHLDRNGKLAYVIGITTEDEYFRDIYLKNPAFGRRFETVPIKNMTRDEAVDTLEFVHIQEAPHILVNRKALEYLFDKSTEHFPEKPQPFHTLSLFQRCISKTDTTQRTPLDTTVDELRQKIQAFYSAAAVGQGDDLLPYGNKEERAKIKALEVELLEAEQKLRAERERLDQFFKTRIKLADAKTSLYQTVLKVAQCHATVLGSKEELDAKSLLLISHYLTRLLHQWVLEEGKELGIRTKIDQALIDEVISEELAIAQQEKETVERARRNISERAATS